MGDASRQRHSTSIIQSEYTTVTRPQAQSYSGFPSKIGGLGRMSGVDLPTTSERNRRRTTAFRSTLLCKLLGRIARIVRIAAIRGEPLDELDNRIAVARFKSDESLQ